MTYRVVLAKAAERDIHNVRNRTVRRRPAEAIETLANNPYPQGAAKLRGVGDIWRIGVGDWRICYAIQTNELVVLVLTVAQRGDVYQRLRRRLE